LLLFEEEEEEDDELDLDLAESDKSPSPGCGAYEPYVRSCLRSLSESES